MNLKEGLCKQGLEFTREGRVWQELDDELEAELRLELEEALEGWLLLEEELLPCRCELVAPAWKTFYE
jgi:hypothetical protein